MAVVPAGCGGGDDESVAGRHLIVSVGDSVASGEGNPDRGLRNWLRPTWCHRSHLSGQAIAADEVIGSNPGADLHFISFACTGATIDQGLLGRFSGHGRHFPQPPQLDRVDALTRTATVEALMISVGANDLGFKDIVVFCAVKRDCQDQTSFGPAVKWARNHHVPRPTLSAYVRERLEEIRAEYRGVDAGIPAEIPRDRVLIVEYFDPTRYPPGVQCPAFDERLIGHPENGLVTPAESRWAHDEVLVPLNEAIKRAADENRWTLVEGVDEAFDGHGICAPKEQRWIRTAKESLAMQLNHSGTLHPSEPGHRATADLIRPKLAAVLGLSPN